MPLKSEKKVLCKTPFLVYNVLRLPHEERLHLQCWLWLSFSNFFLIYFKFPLSWYYIFNFYFKEKEEEKKRRKNTWMVFVAITFLARNWSIFLIAQFFFESQIIVFILDG